MKKNMVYIVMILIIIAIIVVGIVLKSDKPKDYKYRINTTYPSNCTERPRGYYIDSLNEVDAPYFYTICMGEQNSTGYSLELESVTKKDDNVEVIVKEIKPNPGDTVGMALTYPAITIEFPTYQEHIIFKDTLGNEYQLIN